MDMTVIEQANAEFAGEWAEFAYHGGPFDRGGADYYYWREPEPHKYIGGTFNGERITDLTPREYAAYWAGYELAAEMGDRKDWGI